MLSGFRKGVLFLALALVALPAACRPQATTTTAVTYSLPELEYRLFSQFDVFWCDPDFYPIARPESELASARAQFPTIKANETEFSAILNYLSLDRKDSYTDEEKLLIFRQHKKLTLAVQNAAPAEQLGSATGSNQFYRQIGGTLAVALFGIVRFYIRRRKKRSEALTW